MGPLTPAEVGKEGAFPAGDSGDPALPSRRGHGGALPPLSDMRPKFDGGLESQQ